MLVRSGMCERHGVTLKPDHRKRIQLDAFNVLKSISSSNKAACKY